MTNIIFSDDVARIEWSELHQFDSQYGRKCATSLAIPRAWTPPFAIVSSALIGEITPTASLSSILDTAHLHSIFALADPVNELIVRSSIIGESIWDRGTYRSVNFETTGDDAVSWFDAAVREVVASSESRAMGLMIQRYVRPTSQGEFGNLQRISKTRDHWEISTFDPSGGTLRNRLNSQRDQAAEPTAAIAVRSGFARERLFGSVGAWLNNELLLGKSQRLNCEWITDNKQFFLVQIDEEDEDLWGTNPFQVRIPAIIRPQENSGLFLKLADGPALKEWDKLQILDELWEPDAAHKPTLFYAPLCNLMEKSDDNILNDLEGDFRKLIGGLGIIVRTSVKANSEKIPNLPRTECLTPAAAARWCLEMAGTLSEEHELSDLAFVAHRFVASRASAWARAEPGNPIVEINSLWGLPDALQYCPYDIWEVHVPTGVATDYPEYKSDMLISRSDGGWKYTRVRNDLARANSIGSIEVKYIALRSMAIAERLKRACHIMWFVGCAEEDSTTFNIPWYWTEAHPAERNHDRSAYRIFTVSDRDSLQRFIDLDGPRTRQALALRPTDLNLMRDTKFIIEVGNAAKSAGVPIILSGSTLAHAYYQIRKIGCTIVTPSEKEHSRIRRTANLGKLVRDKIPAKIAQRNELEITRKISGNLKKGFLISKVFEEALEIREAADTAQKTEELADLFELLRAIAKAEGVSLEAIKKTADQKKRKAGGFEDGLILLQTGIALPDRGMGTEGERGIGNVLAERTSDDVAEIPFSFFGFMEMDQYRSIYFENLAVRLEVYLRPDRLELRLVRGAEQLGLPFGD